MSGFGGCFVVLCFVSSGLDRAELGWDWAGSWARREWRGDAHVAYLACPCASLPCLLENNMALCLYGSGTGGGVIFLFGPFSFVLLLLPFLYYYGTSPPPYRSLISHLPTAVGYHRLAYHRPANMHRPTRCEKHEHTPQTGLDLSRTILLGACLYTLPWPWGAGE